MLAAAGLDESALQCPADWPLGEAAKLAATEPRQVTMNCSGKHAAMLLTCRANGWPIETYLEPDHPLQLAMRAAVGAESGEAVAATGIDGCGAPLFAISLTGLARAFIQIATAADGPQQSVADAMRPHPDLVAGPDGRRPRCMTAVPGLIAKDGAEGVYAAALPDGRAVALKIDDGAQRATDPVMIAALRARASTYRRGSKPVRCSAGAARSASPGARGSVRLERAALIRAADAGRQGDRRRGRYSRTRSSTAPAAAGVSVVIVVALADTEIWVWTVSDASLITSS